jgi:hypothetical protein
MAHAGNRAKQYASAPITKYQLNLSVCIADIMTENSGAQHTAVRELLTLAQQSRLLRVSSSISRDCPDVRGHRDLCSSELRSTYRSLRQCGVCVCVCEQLLNMKGRV